MKNSLILLTLLSSLLLSEENKFYDQFSIGIGANNMQSATFIKEIEGGAMTYEFGFFRFSNSVTIKEGNEEFSSEVTANIYLPKLGYQRNIGNYNKIDTHALIEGYLIYPTLDINIVGDQGDTDDLEKEIVDFIDLFGLKASY